MRYPSSPFDDSESYQAEAVYHPERRILDGIHRNRGKSGPSSYPSHIATCEVLKHAMDQLDVTTYQLNRLLGCKFEHYCYRWLRGEANPSAVYLLRLVHLLVMASGNLPVSLMRSVDWENSIIVWRNGGITKGEHFPPPNPPNKKNPRRAVETLGSNRLLKELPEMRVSPGISQFGS